MTAIETRSDFYSKNDVTSIDVFKDTRHRATQVLNSTGLGSRIVTAPLIMTTHWDNVAGGYIPEKSQLFIAYQLPAIEHEIAHIVELNDINRLLKVDWGMESGFEFGAKQFFAAVTRETRVRAIQTYLFNDNKDRSVLSNPRWVESAKKYIPFGRYKTYKDFVIWHDDLFLKTLVAWSFDRIMHEWKSRADFIENWMGSVGLNNLHEGSFNKMKYAILNLHVLELAMWLYKPGLF
jgi:hypothetical protein